MNPKYKTFSFLIFIQLRIIGFVHSEPNWNAMDKRSLCLIIMGPQSSLSDGALQEAQKRGIHLTCKSQTEEMNIRNNISKLLAQFKNLPWTERVSKTVTSLILEWLNEDVDLIGREVSSPVYPPSLKITQEKWEGNSEFEDRLSNKRKERQLEIDRLQIEYKVKVEQRNETIRKVTQSRADKEKALPARKKEFIRLVLAALNLPLTPKSVAFDPEVGKFRFSWPQSLQEA